ncbi:Gfo/Idh/MocA family protein [Micromonospora sp. NPDC049175]|uniref:Gfo/Idh/MocA family protein n=1 Tax=Micromonospora sp. NPDC049175 TaxID=3364266 RepID=UPI003713FDD0
MTATGVRVVVVGAGAIAARVHLPYLVADPRVRDVLVSDNDPEAVERSVRTFGVEAHPGDLASSGAGLAVICTPPHSHAALITEALAAGMDVVCEKPLVTSAVAATEIEQMSRKLSRRVFTCYTNRFRADVERLRQVIREGAIGPVHEMSATWSRRSGIPGTPGGWESGVLWDLGAHLVDLMLWCTGWSGRAVALATGVRPPHAGGSATSDWYQNPGAAHREPEVSFQTVNGLAQIGAGTMRMRASWNDAVAADSVTVLAAGSAGHAELRTVFGFSPARQTIAGPSLRLFHQDHGWRELMAGQLRAPTEYHRQMDQALRQDCADDLRSAVRSVSLCDAFAQSLETGKAVVTDVDEEFE